MIISNGTALSIAPQALGETTPNLAQGYFYAYDTLTLAQQQATYAALYRSQPAVTAAVDKIASSASRLTVKVFDTTDATARALDTDSPLAKLMRQPNDKMSSFAFWRWVFSTYEVYGEAFLMKQRDSFGQVINLVPMHPSRVAVKRDELGNITYVFTIGLASAGILMLPETEVIPLLRYNPNSLMRGMSRLEPLRSTLSNEDSIRKATEQFWRKGARPGVVLKHPGQLSQPAQDRLRARFDASHAGVENAGSTVILEEGMEAQIVQLSLEEMQYIESRKFNLEEVARVFDIAPTLLHDLSRATFSNITEQMRSLYRDVMPARLGDIESVLASHLTVEFFPYGDRDVRFSLDEVLRGDFETRATATVALVSSGIMKPAEAREQFDLPVAGETADVLYANGAMLPLGTTPASSTIASSTGPDTAPDEADAIQLNSVSEATVKEYPFPTVRSVMGALSRVKANKADLREALVNEHKKALDTYFEAQREAYKQNTDIDSEEWNDRLTSVLLPLAKATTEATGQNVASSLDAKYDGSSIEDYLKTNAKESAKNINDTTHATVKKHLAEAPDDSDISDIVDDVFDSPVAARKDSISMTRVVVLASLASLVAARVAGAMSKTWVVTSSNPRSDHAEMSGETVALGETFSNGMNGPGDYSGGADEVANCSCELEFNKKD